MVLGTTLRVMLALLPMTLPAQEPQRMVLLASTIGPIDSGIVDLLEDAFEKETGIRVRHVGAGTGAALDLARKGQIDLVMVHAWTLEEAFIAEGFGTERMPLMYNDFVIMGPEVDPAGIRGIKSVVEALKTLKAKGALFVSRGDRSGTHMAELELWAKAGIKPEGPGYQTFERGSEGNVATLRYANEKGAYTVMDRATYLGLRDQIRLAILVEGDEALLNHITLIPVNPARFPAVHHREAMAFAAWLVSPEKGQKLIATFGVKKFGAPLFMAEGRASKTLIRK